MGDRKIISHSKPTLGKEEERAIIEPIRNSHIAQGEKVAQFEDMMANYIGEKYGVAVSSGLAALHLSLIALGIKEDDEVILPSYTCDALLQAVSYVRAKPVIVDAAYSDGNISLDSFKNGFSSRTKAVIIPHTFGFPVGIDKFLDFEVPIIEDCAVAIGGLYKGKRLGSFGKVSVFSFYATKMITTGEGGMILTDDENIANEIKELRDYTKYTTFKIRYNYKMTDVEAVLGICQLKKLSFFISKRKKLFEKYIDLLKEKNNILLPLNRYDNKTMPAFYRFIVKLPGYDIEAVINEMRQRGVFCGRGVLQPLHRLLGLDKDAYPISERLVKEVVSLPIYPSLSIADVEYISENFTEILEKLK
jgi:perosamine synthetase